jgi:hypothetical protein
MGFIPWYGIYTIVWDFMVDKVHALCILEVYGKGAGSFHIPY